MIAPATALAELNSELVGKYVEIGSEVTELTPGWYMLRNVGRNAMVSHEADKNGNVSYMMRSVDDNTYNDYGSADYRANFLFKISASTTEGKYYIESAFGDYFELRTSSATARTQAREYTIAKIDGQTNQFYIQDVATQSVADGNSVGDTFVGWGTTPPTSGGGNSAYCLWRVSILDDINTQRMGVQTLARNYVAELQTLYGLVKNANNYVSNRKQDGEGSYEGLLDNNYATFFHSSWSTAEADITAGIKHHLQANLSKVAPNFRIFFSKRAQNDMDRPIDITVQGSTNGTDFTDITTINSGLPTASNQHNYMSDVINVGDNQYNYLRFVVNETNSTAGRPDYRCFFTFSEFYILPDNEDVTAAAETINAINAQTSGDYSTLVETMLTRKAEIKHKIENAVYDVTFTLPRYGSYESTSTITVPGVLRGTEYTDAASLSEIDWPPFLTVTGVAETNKVVDADNTSFNVEGSWDFPFELNKVYRMDIRKSAADYGCTKLYYDVASGQIKTRHGENAEAFVPQRLFYLEGESFNGTDLTVKFKTVATGADRGFHSEVGDNAVNAVNESPSLFVVSSNPNGTDGVGLLLSTTAGAHLNDVNGTLAPWNSTASKTDVGSFLRFFALTDEDFESLSTGENASFFTAENIAAAKASRSAADMVTLFADYMAALTPAVEAASAAVTEARQYTGSGDNLRIGDGVNLYSGTTVDKLNECITNVTTALNGTSVSAIETASAALTAELDKLTMNLPQAGTFLRVRATTQGMRYLSSANSDHPDYASRGKLTTKNEDQLGVCFYFDGQSLLGYKNGYYLCNNSSQAGFVADDSHADANVATTVEFVEGTGVQVGTYFVKFAGSRYLAATSKNHTQDEAETTHYLTDAGNDPDRAIYTWWLEVLDTLPVEIGESLHAAFMSPVALDIPDDVEAYVITSKAGAKLIMTKIDTGVIPASTPVIVKAGVSAGTYNFPIHAGSESVRAARAADATPILAGSLHTTVLPEGAYTLQQPEGKELGMYPAEAGAVAKGFTSYMVPEQAAGKDGYVLFADGSTTSDIVEIVNGINPEAAVVYDLQGRRLSAPVRGINIINGKKVLVK